MPPTGAALVTRSVISAILIFAATYVVMAIGKLPGYRLDRAGAALLGACLMVAAGVLSLEEAFAAVDMETIALLLGMMIVAANLRLSGFFRMVEAFVMVRARHPLVLLTAIVLVAGFFSALLVNDTICLVMTPIVLDLVRRLGRNPVPYLLSVAMASNAGSVATITGNPQNMIIGSIADLPYAGFAAALTPVALTSLAATIILIALFHPKEFFTRERLVAPKLRASRPNKPLIAKTLLTLVAMVGFFLAGYPVAGVALLGGAFLLFTRRVKAEKVYFDIDWPLLVMFAGLFIVVAGFDKAVIGPEAHAFVARLNLNDMPVLAGVTVVLSNLVSNVPAVLVLEPFVATLADPEKAWLAVAMAATLAGNLTLVASVANLIVAQKARTGGVTISFWAHLRVGAPMTLLSLAFGIWWLS
jgi:Na+/H+ antiporter NhaD/arsenite permease-like protein